MLCFYLLSNKLDKEMQWKEGKDCLRLMVIFLTAKQFADIKGKHGSWGARLAKQAHEAGYQHLKKNG
ncbi:hypothetical protein GCM10020331_012550 [Ectobacillus funiculus]